MTRDQFNQIGRTIFGGDDFVMAMSDMLQVNSRSVQRWASGEKEVPPGIADELQAHLARHVAEAKNLLRIIRKETPRVATLES